MSPGLNTGECLHTPHGHTYTVYSVAISQNGSKVLSGSLDEESIKVWAIRAGQCRRTLQGHDGIVSSPAIIPLNENASNLHHIMNKSKVAYSLGISKRKVKFVK